MFVCLSVCVSQILYGSLETLKMVGFGTLDPWMNIWGCFFFHFFRFLIFGAWERVFRQNEAKTLGQLWDFKNGRIGLKFGTLVPRVNIWCSIFGPREGLLSTRKKPRNFPHRGRGRGRANRGGRGGGRIVGDAARD